MKIFKFGRALSDSLHAQDTAEDLQKKAEKFKLVGLGGFLSVVKYAVFGVLASLNVHLFLITVPGPFGKMIGVMAILFEGFAVYCWNNGSRSAENHRIALWFFAMLFTAVSSFHATCALYEIMGEANRLPWLTVYSRYVAFPLIFGLMILGVCTLYLLHWQTAIAAAHATARQAIARSEAELMSETVNLKHRSQVELARLEFFKTRTKIEAGYVDAIRDYARVLGEGESAINAITNPEVRKQLLEALGRLSLEPSTARRPITLAPAQASSEENSGK